MNFTNTALSERAIQYLQKQERDWRWITERTATLDYLKRHHIPLFEPILQFQTLYSGYKLTLSKHPTDTFTCKLFFRKYVALGMKVDYDKEDSHYYFYCGDHATAQFTFMLSDKGNLCVADEPMQIIYSSFEKFVEQYAFREELQHWHEIPYYHLENTYQLEAFLKERNDFKLQTNCSDEYHQWFCSPNSVFVKGVWLGPQAIIFTFMVSLNKTERVCWKNLYKGKSLNK